MQPTLSVLVGLMLTSIFAVALPSARRSSDLMIRGSGSPPAYDLFVGGKTAYEYDFSKSAEPCEFDPSRLGDLELLGAGAANGTLEGTTIKRDDGSDIDIVSRAPIRDAAVAVFTNLHCDTASGYAAFARVQRGRLVCLMESQFGYLFVCISSNDEPSPLTYQ